MKTLDPGLATNPASVPRVLMSIALGVLRTLDRTIARDGRLPTARGNAWAAICADRERARQRDEIRRAVIALGRTTEPRTAGVRTAEAQPGR